MNNLKTEELKNNIPSLQKYPLDRVIKEDGEDTKTSSFIIITLVISIIAGLLTLYERYTIGTPMDLKSQIEQQQFTIDSLRLEINKFTLKLNEK